RKPGADGPFHEEPFDGRRDALDHGSGPRADEHRSLAESAADRSRASPVGAMTETWAWGFRYGRLGNARPSWPSHVSRRGGPWAGAPCKRPVCVARLASPDGRGRTGGHIRGNPSAPAVASIEPPAKLDEPLGIVRLARLERRRDRPVNDVEETLAALLAGVAAELLRQAIPVRVGRVDAGWVRFHFKEP